MGPLAWILASTVAISLTAWVGILTLFLADGLVDRVLLVPVVLAAGSLLGGVVGFYLSDLFAGVPAYLLAFAAGNFLHVASAGLVPEIKREADLRRSLLHFGVFLLGIVLMAAIRLLRVPTG